MTNAVTNEPSVTLEQYFAAHYTPFDRGGKLNTPAEVVKAKIAHGKAMVEAYAEEEAES